MSAGTLIELLEMRAAETPSKPAFHWQNEPCPFRELWQEVRRFGSCLQDRGVCPGDRVVLALPNGREFFFAFYGAQLAGAIAVPLYPASGAARILAIAGKCGARTIVIPSASAEAREEEFGPPRPDIQLLSSLDCRGTAVRAHFPEPDDIAFIQYTSGSTGTPKGVLLSHGGLMINIRQLIEGMRITSEDRFVSWLPVYHDMGLILKTMVPFYLAAGLVLLPTSLANIHLWLDAIRQYRATLTAAPDFAYRLCLRHVRNPAGYDLTSLRVALNAAEPVRYKTIREFERAFGLRNVMIPGYGLAEATVGVSTWEPGTPVRVDPRGIVSVGRPFRGITVEIVSDEIALEPGQTGEIMIHSPANTSGYYSSPEETSRLFWKDRYIRTGDQGYLDPDGLLFVTGRTKNIIKQGGEAIFPQEVEQMVESMPEVRRCAAVGLDRGGAEGEQLYVFAELRKSHAIGEDELYEMGTGVVQTIFRQLGTRPGRVYFLQPRAIPQTYNGKLQYGVLKELYVSGRLRKDGAIVFPPW